MFWNLACGKWRPRLLDFVSALDDSVVKSASEKAIRSFPDISKAISELTVLKGVGPATASAVLAAYASKVAPFMSDEDLSMEGETFTPSDVERALWSCRVALLGPSYLHKKYQTPKVRQVKTPSGRESVDIVLTILEL